SCLASSSVHSLKLSGTLLVSVAIGSDIGMVQSPLGAFIRHPILGGSAGDKGTSTENSRNAG
ncbi:MAG: hypothetical protein ABW086_13540, partial [Sedimenticola sp.]